MPKVVIIGGGVAGMSAAHELLDRGFDVDVYEFRDVPGGKARSIPSPHTGVDGRQDLPGEHGFRFFPGFYKHIIDTMQRIPVKDPTGQVNSVADHLVIAPLIMMARYSGDPLVSSTRFPQSVADIERIFRNVFESHLNISDADYEFFAMRLWQIMTTCWDRRREEYDKISWWQFIDAANPSRSADYRKYFAIGLTRTLVAAKADEVSIKTGGDILIQLLLDLAKPGFYSDRLLDGPTSDIWIDPWLNYLTAPQPGRPKAARFFFNKRLQRFLCDSAQVTSAILTDPDLTNPEEVTADYFIAAVPVEVMVEHIENTQRAKAQDPSITTILDLDPSIQAIQVLSEHVRWMVGIQYFLTQDVVINKGHVTYIDTPWALTSISQKQFWKSTDLSTYGNGSVKGILSVDVSDWTTPGCVPPDSYAPPIHTPGLPYPGPMPQQDDTWVMKAAQDCSPFQVMVGTWNQMKLSLNHPSVQITDEMIYDWFLSPDKIYWHQPDSGPGSGITAPPTNNASAPIPTTWPPCTNEGSPAQAYVPGSAKPPTILTTAELGEPLLVNAVKTWAHRPDAFTNIPNFFFASDYVRTFTDLATMEGANEAGRRAVNAILSVSDTKTKYCRLWNLHEPDILAPYRLYDSFRYDQGLPWKNRIPCPMWLLKLLSWIGKTIERIYKSSVSKDSAE